MTKAKELVLIDGSALAFRSYFALMRHGLRRADGTPTGAVYGFFNALFDLLGSHKPDMIACCFDLKEPTFRHIEYTEYKANRAEMPDELATQWPIIKEGVQVFDIPLYELAGYEADDIIGTVADQAAAQGIHVTILTGDQDAFQLLNGEIAVLMPSSKGGLVNYGSKEVFEKLGVYPEQIIDYKALCGDSSDNIPGVRGIGPKTASGLLSEYKTLDGIYQSLDKISSKSVKAKLEEGKESAFVSQRLATIVKDVPLKFDFAHCNLTMPDVTAVAEFLRKLEFKKMINQLPQILKPFNGGVEPVIDQAALAPQALSQPSTPGGDTESQSQAAGSENAAAGQLRLDFLSPQITPLQQTPTQIIRSEKELDSLIAKLSKQSVLSVDLETTGLDSLDCEIVGYALAWADTAKTSSNQRFSVDGKLSGQGQAYIPVRHFGEASVAPEVAEAKLKPLLEDARIGKIAQNAKFEMNILSLCGIKFGPVVFDPMLASYIYDPDEKHGLKDQSDRLLGHQMTRITDLIGQGRNQLTMDKVPVDKAAPYACDDARVALELAAYWLGKLDEKQSYLLWEMELPLQAVLAKMEQTGVALDLPYLKQFSGELAEALVELESDIFKLAGRTFNINSTQQLQQVLFDHLKLTPKGRTKSGYSTDAAVLEKLINEHEIVGKVLEFRQLSKLRSTYVDALPKQVSPRDGRLHGEFNQTVTSTGRLSSSSPNLQNIPIRTELGRRIRRAFIPGEKNSLLISADYSQIELRLLADVSGDEMLIDAFKKGEDVHARTAAEIFDKPLDEVTSDMRRIGKTINFSLVYQQGAYSTAQDLGITPKEAQAFTDKYFSRYPKVDKYLKGSIEEARQKGYAATLWGRRRYFRHLNDRNENIRRADERAACNAPLQGSAADLMKLAMIRLDQVMSKQSLTGKLILQVHDELVLEVPESELEATKKVVIEAMQLDEPLKVPLQVDCASGKNWMDAK